MHRACESKDQTLNKRRTTFLFRRSTWGEIWAPTNASNSNRKDNSYTCRKKPWGINFCANTCGACIRTRANTGKYIWGGISRALCQILRGSHCKSFGPNTCRACIRTRANTSETGRIRFRIVRFQTPSSVSVLGSLFRGPNSVSSFRPIICVQTRTHRVSRRTHRVCRRTQWVLFSETVLSKQYSARFPIQENIPFESFMYWFRARGYCGGSKLLRRSIFSTAGSFGVSSES